jgi:RNA recognition motif-containing protein
LQVTIHDYSIRVERLPQDATADELVDFFGQYGEVRSSSSNRGAFKHTVARLMTVDARATNLQVLCLELWLLS